MGLCIGKDVSGKNNNDVMKTSKMVKWTLFLCLFFMSSICLLKVQAQTFATESVAYDNIYLDNLLIKSKVNQASLEIPDVLIDYYYGELLKDKFNHIREIIPVETKFNDSTSITDVYYFSHKANTGFCLINKFISQELLRHNFAFGNQIYKVNYLYNGSLVNSDDELEKLMSLNQDHVRISSVACDTLNHIVDVEFYDNEAFHHLKSSFIQNEHYFKERAGYFYSIQVNKFIFINNLLTHGSFSDKKCLFISEDSVEIALEYYHKMITLPLNAFYKNIYLYWDLSAQDGFLYLNDLMNACFFEYYNAYSKKTIGIEYVYDDHKIRTSEAYRKLMLLNKNEIRVSFIVNDIEKNSITSYFTSDIPNYISNTSNYFYLLNY